MDSNGEHGAQRLTPNHEPSLVVLIDADNASPAVLEGLLAEVSKYGIASVKRIYGDWTTPRLGSWKPKLLEHSVQPIQQFAYTAGKNATDSAMIIDAMDLLHTGRFDGFCLVSSDSDFTRLAARIREEGIRVYGFGEEKTPESFRAACDRFVFTEVLLNADGDKKAANQSTSKALRGNTRLVNQFRAAIEASSDDDGWATLSAVGSHIMKQSPDFDPRNFGYKKLSELAQAIGLFQMDRKAGPVRIKNRH